MDVFNVPDPNIRVEFDALAAPKPGKTKQFDQGDPRKLTDTFLNSLWNQLPSNRFPDFVGMEKKVNQMKGTMMNPGLVDFPTLNGADQLLEAWVRMGMVTQFLTKEEFSAFQKFQRTNQRIYSELAVFDNVITTCHADNPNIQPNWAEKYKTFMTGYFSTAQDLLQEKIKSITTQFNDAMTLGTATGADGHTTATVNAIGSSFSAVLETYPPSSMTYDQDKLFGGWPAPTPLNKRDAPACALPTTTSSKSSTATLAPSTVPGTGPGCGTNLGQVPCPASSTSASSSSASSSSTNWNTIISITSFPPTSTIAAATSTSDGPLKVTAAGCADPENVVACDSSENADRPR
jgi:hypothetical protein